MAWEPFGLEPVPTAGFQRCLQDYQCEALAKLCSLGPGAVGPAAHDAVEECLLQGGPRGQGSSQPVSCAQGSSLSSRTCSTHSSLPTVPLLPVFLGRDPPLPGKPRCPLLGSDDFMGLCSLGLQPLLNNPRKCLPTSCCLW